MATTTSKSSTKTYTVVKHRQGRRYERTGTLAELIQDFSYTLDCGYSYNRAINRNPNTIRGLIAALNKSAAETQRGSYSPESYSLAE